MTKRLCEAGEPPTAFLLQAATPPSVTLKEERSTQVSDLSICAVLGIRPGTLLQARQALCAELRECIGRHHVHAPVCVSGCRHPGTRRLLGPGTARVDWDLSGSVGKASDNWAQTQEIVLLHERSLWAQSWSS